MSAERASRYGLRAVALGYLGLLLFVPVAIVLYRTFEPGLDAVWASITTPAAQSAFRLTLLVRSSRSP
jgi:sulfate transport system permease protein